MVGLEPSQDACQLAQLNCAAYPQVKVINTTFEEWELGSNKFNAVLAATSFHWITPEIRYQKSAEALQDNGYLILLWNTQVMKRAALTILSSQPRKQALLPQGPGSHVHSCGVR